MKKSAGLPVLPGMGRGKGREGFLNRTPPWVRSSHTLTQQLQRPLGIKSLPSQLPLFASRASYQPGCTSAPPLRVKAPPPRQLFSHQAAALGPLPTWLISLKSCIIQSLGRFGVDALISAPSPPGWQLQDDLSEALSWEEPASSGFCSPDPAGRHCKPWCRQLETLARCFATAPLRAGLPG